MINPNKFLWVKIIFAFFLWGVFIAIIIGNEKIIFLMHYVGIAGFGLGMGYYIHYIYDVIKEILT